MSSEGFRVFLSFWCIFPPPIFVLFFVIIFLVIMGHVWLVGHSLWIFFSFLCDLGTCHHDVGMASKGRGGERCRRGNARDAYAPPQRCP